MCPFARSRASHHNIYGVFCLYCFLPATFMHCPDGVTERPTRAGLAAAALATLAPLPGFSDAGGEWGGGETPGPWRRLLRRQTSPRKAAEDGDGRTEGARDTRGKRRHVVLVEREVSCRYSDAVRGLLAASHGQAVRAVAAGGNGDGNPEKDEGLLEAVASLAGGYNTSSSVFQGLAKGSRITFFVTGLVLVALLRRETLVFRRFTGC